MKISFTTALTPFLLSLMLTLDRFQTIGAVNFGNLDTPLLDSLEGFLCSDREGPICNMFGSVLGDEAEVREGQAVVPQGEQMTLREFMVSVSCSSGLIPGNFCQALGQDAGPSLVGGGEPQQVAVKQEGAADRIVDGFFLNMLCGEDGYAPASACVAMVGADGNSGLIRTMCQSGVVTTHRLCGMAGVENPAQPSGRDGGGRRMLRQRK